MAVVRKPAVALPEVELDRETLKREVVRFLGEDFPRLKTVMRIIDNSGIEKRYLARGLADILEPIGFGERNDQYIEAVKDLSERAAADALKNAGLHARDIDLLITTSCTGFMIPSVCAHLIPEMGFRRDCVRLPITELGCAAGAVAVSRARDFIAARPGSNVLIVAAELCSLTFQPRDLSMQAIVGGLLFGDGAAAACVTPQGSGFDVEVSGQYLFEDSWDYMGFDVQDSGFHLILDKGVPGAVSTQIAPVMKAFLDERAPEGVDFFCLHPGGRKLMDQIESSFALKPRDLEASRRCLAEVGNLSSASVLVVLKHFFEDPPDDGERGLLAAFGPGFSVEMAVGNWRA